MHEHRVSIGAVLDTEYRPLFTQHSDWLSHWHIWPFNCIWLPSTYYFSGKLLSEWNVYKFRAVGGCHLSPCISSAGWGVNLRDPPSLPSNSLRRRGELMIFADGSLLFSLSLPSQCRFSVWKKGERWAAEMSYGERRQIISCPPPRVLDRT